ncbi:hypothetical protein D3C71_1713640 [compost metagenome]
MDNVVVQIADNFLPIDFDCRQDFISGKRMFSTENEEFSKWLSTNGLKTDFQHNRGVRQQYILRGSEIIGQYWNNEHEYHMVQNKVFC